MVAEEGDFLAYSNGRGKRRVVLVSGVGEVRMLQIPLQRPEHGVFDIVRWSDF